MLGVSGLIVIGSEAHMYFVIPQVIGLCPVRIPSQFKLAWTAFVTKKGQLS